MNPKIEQIETAESAIDDFIVEQEELRDTALADGIIDADEQADLDRIASKIEQLRGVVRTLRSEMEENRRIWDAQQPARTEWAEQLATLQEAGKPDLRSFETSAEDMETLVEEQRWADATQELSTTREAMAPVYAAYMEEVAAMAGGGGGGAGAGAGAPAAPPAPSVNPEETEWVSLQQEYHSSIAALERHAHAGSPPIAAEIVTIKASATVAEGLASTADFAGAIAEMRPLLASCAATEDKAHDYAQYQGIQTQRAALVGHPSGAPVNVALIDDLQTEMATLLADATTDASGGDFDASVAKLNRIPPIFDRKQGMNQMRQEYDAGITWTVPYITSIGNATDENRAPFQADFDRLKTEHAAALIAATNDYSVSAHRIWEIKAELEGIDNALGNVVAYTNALSAFNGLLTTMEGHTGRVAIEEFYQAKVLERDQAVLEAGGNRHPAAIAILARTSAGDWAAQTAIADAYDVYQTNRTATQAVIDEVRALPDTADLIGQADALMTTAANQAIAGDITAAEASVAEANTRAEDARSASEAMSALGDLHDEDALDNAAADFPAAMAVYTNMRANVAGQDSAGAFAAQLTAADVPANAAQAEVDGGSPDMDNVRAKLDEAIALVDAILPQVIARNLYQTHHADATALIGRITTANASNDNCIQAAVDACAALLVEAEGLAQDPTLDFQGAEAKLAELMESGRAAEANVALYNGTIQPNLGLANTGVTNIAGSGGNIPNRLAASTTRLNDLISDATSAMSTGDFALADAKAMEAAQVAAAVGQDITICQNIDSRYQIEITNRIAQIQTGEPEVADALALANTKIAEFNAAMTAGSYRLADQLWREISLAISAGIRAKAQSGPYNAAQAATRAKLDAVVAVTNAGVETQLAALEERYAAAEALGAEPQYVNAMNRMNDIGPEADALLPIATAFAAYDTARTAAETALVAAETHAQLEAIETTVTMLRTKFQNAEGAAAGGDHARATTQMGEVESGANEAVENADNVAIFAGIAGAIGDSSSDSWGPTMAHIAAARQAHSWQAEKDNASVAQAELDEAETKIGLAEDSSLPAQDQTTALESAMDLVTQAGQIISQHVLLTQSLDDARARLAVLRSHPQAAYLNAQLNEMAAGIDAAEAGASDLAALPGCAADIEQIMANVTDYQTKMDAQQEYETLRPSTDVEPKLAVLEAHSASYAIQTNIDAMRSKLDNAARLSEQFDPVAAVEVLNEVKTLGLSAFVLAEMHANNPPTRADIEEILSRPDGTTELDAMIDTLPTDAQLGVMQVAFEARFGCTLQDLTGAAGAAAPPGQPAPDIRRFYEIMSDLPTTDLLDNDSLRTFTVQAAGSASSYTGGGVREIDMQEGPAVTSSAVNFGSPAEVGEVDPECEPANNDPVNSFTWNTLHEVGHAVDEQHGFMNRNQGGSAYGGWVVYGGNVGPIADVLANHFNFDKTYIEQSMGRTLPVPIAGGGTTPGDVNPAAPVPSGCSPEEWEGRRVAFATWLARVREPAEPWMSNSTAQQIAIGGIVYHECYTAEWVSYQLAARSKGISGYQFRSPAEWFSEIYAAYHSGKLKSGHPSEGWLSELANPEDV